MKQVFGVLLILVALLIFYDAFKAWQGLHQFEFLADLMSMGGGTPKQDAIFQGIFAIVTFAFGVVLVDD